MSSDYIQENDDGSVTILLQYPIKAKDKVPGLDEITLRAPTMGDLEKSDSVKGDIGKTLSIVESLSGTTMRQLRQLHPRDFRRVGDFLERHVGEDSPETGES
jgi:hypothetical protein